MAGYLNIGAMIKMEVDRQRWNYADFARAINCSRSSVYHIFNSADITVNRLMEIGRVLGRDFMSELCCARAVSEGPNPSGNSSEPFIAIPMSALGLDADSYAKCLARMIREEGRDTEG